MPELPSAEPRFPHTEVPPSLHRPVLLFPRTEELLSEELLSALSLRCNRLLPAHLPLPVRLSMPGMLPELPLQYHILPAHLPG